MGVIFPEVKKQMDLTLFVNTNFLNPKRSFVGRASKSQEKSRSDLDPNLLFVVFRLPTQIYRQLTHRTRCDVIFNNLRNNAK